MNTRIDIDIELSWNDVLKHSMYLFYTSPVVLFLTGIALAALVYHIATVMGFIYDARGTNHLITVFWSFILFGAPLITYLYAKYNYEHNENFKNKASYRIDKIGIQIYAKNDFERLNWEKVIRIKETKNTILFYREHAIANILPKRFMTKENLTDLRQIIRSKQNPNFKVKK